MSLTENEPNVLSDLAETITVDEPEQDGLDPEIEVAEEETNPIFTMNRLFSDGELDDMFCRHKYTDETAAGSRAVRRQFRDLAHFLDMMLPKSRQKVLCLTELESSAAYAIKAIETRAAIVKE